MSRGFESHTLRTRPFGYFHRRHWGISPPIRALVRICGRVSGSEGAVPMCTFCGGAPGVRSDRLSKTIPDLGFRVQLAPVGPHMQSGEASSGSRCLASLPELPGWGCSSLESRRWLGLLMTPIQAGRAGLRAVFVSAAAANLRPARSDSRRVLRAQLEGLLLAEGVVLTDRGAMPLGGDVGALFASRRETANGCDDSHAARSVPSTLGWVVVDGPRSAAAVAWKRLAGVGSAVRRGHGRRLRLLLVDESAGGAPIAAVELCDARGVFADWAGWSEWPELQRRAKLSRVFGVNVLRVGAGYARALDEGAVMSRLRDATVRAVLLERYGVDVVALEVQRDALSLSLVSGGGSASATAVLVPVGRGRDRSVLLCGAAADVVVEAAVRAGCHAPRRALGDPIAGDAAVARRGLVAVGLPAAALRVPGSGDEYFLLPLVRGFETVLRGSP